MSKNIDIVYFYEYAARELDVACAVKCLVQKKYGLRIEILKWPQEGFTHLMRSGPKVVILPFCYSARHYYKPLMEWRNAIFFNLAWEQLFYRGNIEDKIPQDLFSIKHVMHHAWSQAHVDFLLKHGVPRENIFLNGNPAYALYLAPYRKYFESSTRSCMGNRYGLDTGKRWVFFPENYNWAFLPSSAIEQFADAGVEKEDIREMARYCRESLGEVMRWCENAARSGNVEIVIRPRHTIGTADFCSFVNKVVPSLSPNIHIIREGTVREWILVSDLIVSSYSTSLIEAAVAGKPSFMLEPIQMPDSLHVKWHDLAAKIKTQSEFITACEEVGNVEKNIELQKWARDAMLSNGDCIMKIAQILGMLCRNGMRRPAIPKKDTISVPENLRVLWWAFYAFGRMQYLSTKNRIEKNRSGKMFRKYLTNQQDIDRRVNDWGGVLSSQP